MQIDELLAELRQLSHADKLRVIQFLVSELAKEEGIKPVSELEPNVDINYDSQSLAHQLVLFLEELL